MNSGRSSAATSGLSALRRDLKSYGVTTGASDSFDYYLSPRMTQQARALLSHIEDPDVARRTAEVLTAIEEELSAFAASGGDIQVLKPVRASLLPDGSVSIEWIQREFRVGFNIERDPTESGWYLVTSKLLGDTGVFQSLSGRPIRSIVSPAFELLRANS